MKMRLLHIGLQGPEGGGRKSALPSLLLLCCLLLCAGPLASAQPTNYWECLPVAGDLKYENLPFQVGEHIKYNINYKWGVINGNVCKADMRMEAKTYNGIPALGVRIYGQTNSFYDNFFKVREDMRATFTRDGLVPLYAYREAKEGNYTMTNEARWVYDADPPYIQNVKETSKKGRQESTVAVRPCLTDLLTVFYMLRCLDFDKLLEMGEFTMYYTMDGKTKETKAKVVGREDYNVKGVGKIPAIKLGAVISSDGKYGYAYYSECPGHILLGFNVPIVVGYASASISDWEMLKYPLQPVEKK